MLAASPEDQASSPPSQEAHPAKSRHAETEQGPAAGVATTAEDRLRQHTFLVMGQEVDTGHPGQHWDLGEPGLALDKWEPHSTLRSSPFSNLLSLPASKDAALGRTWSSGPGRGWGEWGGHLPEPVPAPLHPRSRSAAASGCLLPSSTFQGLKSPNSLYPLPPSPACPFLQLRDAPSPQTQTNRQLLSPIWSSPFPRCFCVFAEGSPPYPRLPREPQHCALAHLSEVADPRQQPGPPKGRNPLRNDHFPQTCRQAS